MEVRGGRGREVRGEEERGERGGKRGERERGERGEGGGEEWGRMVGKIVDSVSIDMMCERVYLYPLA